MRAKSKIDRLIVNSPYEEPRFHWQYDRESRTFSLANGRRPAGYLVATADSQAFDDPGHFVELPLVNKIRRRVKAWREDGYVGATGITKRLFSHWINSEKYETRRFFFCQLEAIETFIWLVESPERDRIGLSIPKDGGNFLRLCAKMATGTGKTLVMAMLVSWNVINKVTFPRDSRFAKDILVVAPGLTIKSRLDVLDPMNTENYYQSFNIVPHSLLSKLRRGRVLIRNWHALNWETENRLVNRRSVDKRGARSNEAYARAVLGEMADCRKILVINDEAHHAWRMTAESNVKGVAKEHVEIATKWIGGLDRIDDRRQILACYDFTATPFAPISSKSASESLFGWIVSDFGLNDAIESGLVKTPRVVIRDDAVPDAKTYMSRLYHIYNDPEVRDDLNRKAPPETPLPDLVINGYYLLGYDWRETKNNWKKAGTLTPPVMITVANRTETAARVKYALDNNKVRIEELWNPNYTLHIDTKVLQSAEAALEPIATFGREEEEDFSSNESHQQLTRKQRAELLRRKIDTIGKIGKPGEQIQNVISVSMLSEGWDAQTVTHIMGLRAFSSQLLCEQVVGRGLRRTSYDVDHQSGLFKPEYVNIFGVPFTFLPHEENEHAIPKPTEPKTAIEAVKEKREFRLSWPNVLRIDRIYRPCLYVNWSDVDELVLNGSECAQVANLAPIVDGKPDVTKVSVIDIESLAAEFRTQRIVFETARDVYDQMKKNWTGSKEFLLIQLVGLVDEFMQSDRIRILPTLFNSDKVRRRLVITLNMFKVMQHIWEDIRFKNTSKLVPVFDRDEPINSTSDMATWFTGKPCQFTKRSHINYCVYDSSWEASDAYVLDHYPAVNSWAKNDHLGFEIHYVYRGILRKYRPDFIVKMQSGNHIILETKGLDRDEDKVKRKYLNEWVAAVNAHGGFGSWSWGVSRRPGDLLDILDSAIRST